MVSNSFSWNKANTTFFFLSKQFKVYLSKGCLFLNFRYLPGKSTTKWGKSVSTSGIKSPTFSWKYLVVFKMPEMLHIWVVHMEKHNMQNHQRHWDAKTFFHKPNKRACPLSVCHTTHVNLPGHIKSGSFPSTSIYWPHQTIHLDTLRCIQSQTSHKAHNENSEV